jgi:putative transposase
MTVEKFKGKVRISRLLAWCSEHKSGWYYRQSENRPGRKPSTQTMTVTGSSVSNQEVVEAIRKILNEEFICYGYQKTTSELRDAGFIINPKKTYRLMAEEKLLLNKKIIPATGKREFVKVRKVNAEYPMQYLAMDIKYVYIHGEKRNVFLLTVIDICTRKVLGHVLKPSIKKHDVILLLDGVLQEYKVKGIRLRNDNGSQFIAHLVREYLKENDVVQEFTHVATPEENGHIEALHSILEREVIRRYWFDTYHYAKWKIADYYRFYNSKRRHGSIKMMSPEKYWQLFFSDYLPNAKPAESGMIVKGSDAGGTCEALDNHGAKATFALVNKTQSLLN